MIDFKQELEKYDVVLGIEQVENSVKTEDIKDILGLLTHITDKIDK